MSASLHELAERLGKAREHCRWAEVAAVEGALMAWNKPRSAPAWLPTMDIHPDLAADLAAMNAPHELRAEQATRAMPVVGPLLDAWDGLSNDFRSADEMSQVRKWMGALNAAMEGDVELLPTPSRAAGTEAVQAGEAVGELEVDELGATAFVNDTGRELPYGVYPLYVTRLLSEPVAGAVAQEAADPVGWLMESKGYGRPPEFYRERPPFVPPISTLRPLIYGDAPAHPEAAKDAERSACKWAQEDWESDCWGTTCGHYFSVNEGAPEWPFCCYCAKPLVAEPWKDEDEEADEPAALASSKSKGREA